MKMRRGLLPWLALCLALVVIFSNVAFMANGTDVMKMSQELHLRHPRRGESLTLIGDKIWVTGGKSYISFFNKWGQEGFEPFTTNPNVEIVDLTTGLSTYTKIDTKEPFYKSTAFTVADNATIIYMAASNLLSKLDTQKMTFEPIKDFGEPGQRTKAAWGRMTIKGKSYVVIVSEDKAISFFDPAVEKFVKLDGVVAKVPVAGAGGAVVDNKFYIFGGNTAGDDSGGTGAWVFDPNAADASAQLKPITPLPMPLAFPNGAAFGGKVLLFGGGSAGDIVKTVFEYNPATNAYIRKTDLPQALLNGGVAVRGDMIYLTFGYSWGTEAEGKLGFQIHPPYFILYQPKLDATNQPFMTKESVQGDKMNINLSWPDPDKMAGASQTIAVNWTAATSSTAGYVYLRKQGTQKYAQVAASGVNYAQAMAEARAYTAMLKNLTPFTYYEYYAVSDGPTKITSPVYTFRTQPTAIKKSQVFIFGDSKSEYNITNELNGEILPRMQADLQADVPYTPGFSVQLGDFGGFGAFGEYDAWFNYTFNGKSNSRDLVASFPFVAVHGNHENLLPSYFNCFAYPTQAMQGWPVLNNQGNEEKWYSFNYGKAHFAVLTTGTYTAEGWYSKAQLEWLKADLDYAKQQKAAGKIKWVFVMCHTPFFTSGDHFKDLNAQGFHDAGSYLDVIEANGAVDVVLTGHDHDYERTKNIKGYRWALKDGKPGYVALENAFAEEESGRWGEATKGLGTIYMVIGGAGAAQRDMNARSKLGDSTWLAARKPEPDRGETAAAAPSFHYAVMTITDDELMIEVFEKNISYLPEYKNADDTFEGLLDRIIIR